MAGPDLTFATQQVEALMDDLCRIERDEEAGADDVLDPETLELLRPEPDTITIYEGPCMIRPLDQFERMRTEGGATVGVELYRIGIPIAATLTLQPEPGDFVAVLTSLRDPHLPGERFRVRKVNRRTLGVSRSMVIERRAEIRDRP